MYQNMTNKMNNMSMAGDSMGVMKKTAGMQDFMGRGGMGPGGGLNSGPNGYGGNRFPNMTTPPVTGTNNSMYTGPSQYNGPPFHRQSNPSFPASAAGGGGGRLSPQGGLRGLAGGPPPPPAGGGGGGGGPHNNLPPGQTPSQNNGGDGEVGVNDQDQHQVSVFSEGGTTYFYNPDESLSSQLSTGAINGGSVLLPNWSAYSGTPSQVVAMKVRGTAPSSTRESDIKLEILGRQQICHTAADPESHPDLPAEVDNFTNLCPLEPPAVSPMHKSSTFGYVTTVYKAVNVKTGQHMCLRRIHGYRLVNTKCMSLVDQWKKMAHSNLVSLRQVFTSKSFGDHSMVFVYDFYPGAETLMSKHFNNSVGLGVGGGGMINDMSQGAFNGDGHNSSSRPYSQQKNNMLRQQAVMSSGLLPEAIIWNYIIQLTSALRCIHGAGLACRTLDPTKILVINKTRVLLNCVGIFDVLTFDPNSSNPVTAMAVYQQEDLVSLGRIALALACNSFMAIQRENLQASMEVVTSTYSSDLRNLIMYLLTNPQRVKTVNDLMPMIGARFYTALDSAQQRNDALEVELAKDIESARLFKLLAKLSTVVDRAEFHMDTSWAETGDRYMLKLFRDYVFHQVMEDGRPFLDMSHVIANLNKLDTGVPDQICLMSRDEQNVLVVSYAELKNCLEQSYGDILASATAKPKLQ